MAYPAETVPKSGNLRVMVLHPFQLLRIDPSKVHHSEHSHPRVILLQRDQSVFEILFLGINQDDKVVLRELCELNIDQTVVFAKFKLCRSGQDTMGMGRQSEVSCLDGDVLDNHLWS